MRQLISTARREWRRAWPGYSELGTSALIVLALITSAYTLTYSGAFQVDDEHVFAARAQSLAFWGQPSFTQVYGNERVQTLAMIPVAEALPSQNWEPAQTVLGASLYRIARALGVGGAQFALTLSLYLTALTAATVYLTVRTIGYPHRTASWTALVFGLGTMAWPYAMRYFRDTVAMFALALIFLGWALAVRPKGPRLTAGISLLAVGFIAGALSKNTMIPILLGFALSVVVLVLITNQERRRGFRTTRSLMIPLGLLFLTSILSPAFGPLSRHSFAYYLETAHLLLERMDLSYLPAALGPYISPAKSIFLFSPILILAPVSVVVWWKELWRFVIPLILAAVLLPAAQALFLGEMWPGTLIWGLRFMLPLLPPLTVACAPCIQHILISEKKWFWFGLWSLFGLSIVVQLAGVVVPWHLPFKVWLDRGLDPYSPKAVWDLQFWSPPIHLARFWSIPRWEVAWIRALPSQPIALLIPIAALALGAASLRLLRNISRSRPGLIHARFRPALILAFSALLLPVAPGLYFYSRDPAVGGDRPEFVRLTSWMKAEVREQDLIVMDSYGTPLWHHMMNAWTSPVPWYSLSFEIPGSAGVPSVIGGDPSEGTITLLSRASEGYERLWYVTTEDSADYGLRREVGWLDEMFSLAMTRSFRSDLHAEVRVYVLD